MKVRIGLGLAMLFSAGAMPAGAATITTFDVSGYVFPPSFMGSNIPSPIGTVTIDTAAGRVVGNTIRTDFPNLPQTTGQRFETAEGAVVYTFSVQPSDRLRYTYSLFFPVSSLVGYAGGPLGRYQYYGGVPVFDDTAPFLTATFLDPATGADVGGQTQDYLRVGTVYPTAVAEPVALLLSITAFGIGCGTAHTFRNQPAAVERT